MLHTKLSIVVILLSIFIVSSKKQEVAKCGIGCGSEGVCIQNVCHCKEPNYGDHCEKSNLNIKNISNKNTQNRIYASRISGISKCAGGNNICSIYQMLM